MGYSRVELYEQARRSRDEGLLYREIVEMTGVPYATVHSWVCEGRRPLNHVFPPSPEIAYLIGLKFGDGSVPKSFPPHFSLGVKDRDFVEEVNRCLCIVLGRKEPYNIYPCPSNQTFAIVSASRYLARFLKKDLEELKPVVEKYPNDFLRGVYDSEGSCSRVRERRHLLRVELGNTNLKLVTLAQELLKKLGIRSKINSVSLSEHPTAKAEKYHKLRINRQQDIRLFIEKIGFSIKRKRVWECD